MQNSRWNTDNMKVEGVMAVPDTNIVFVDAAHPIWDYARTNPDGERILSHACIIENHFKCNKDGFYVMCDSMQKELEVQ